jgi:molybdate transport system substrate-binding protein
MRKVFAILLLAAAVGLGFYGLRPKTRSSTSSLTVYCAAGLKKPIEAIAAQYQQEFGTQIELQFGGHGHAAQPAPHREQRRPLHRRR